jgi:hypothetical protein
MVKPKTAIPLDAFIADISWFDHDCPLSVFEKEGRGISSRPWSVCREIFFKSRMSYEFGNPFQP